MVTDGFVVLSDIRYGDTMFGHILLVFSLRCFEPFQFGSAFLRSISFSIGFLHVRISDQIS